MKIESMRQAVEQVTKNYFAIYPSAYYPPYEARHNLLPSKNGQPKVQNDAMWEFTARVYRFNDNSGEVDIFEESGVVISFAASDCDCKHDAIFYIKKFYEKNNMGAVTVTSCWLVRDRLITSPDTDLNNLFWSMDSSRVKILNSERLS
jgi:hypothetical protein